MQFAGGTYDGGRCGVRFCHQPKIVKQTALLLARPDQTCPQRQQQGSEEACGKGAAASTAEVVASARVCCCCCSSPQHRPVLIKPAAAANGSGSRCERTCSSCRATGIGGRKFVLRAACPSRGLQQSRVYLTSAVYATCRRSATRRHRQAKE